jgi:hypothetical protein
MQTQYVQENDRSISDFFFSGERGLSNLLIKHKIKPKNHYSILKLNNQLRNQPLKFYPMHKNNHLFINENKITISQEDAYINQLYGSIQVSM